MKKLIATALCLATVTSFAAAPDFDNISKSDLEKVGNEFAMNFSHSTVSAPETKGLWGIEVGVMGGSSASPKLRKAIDNNGGDGSDFKNLYHAGLLARVHVPFDFFIEASLLPGMEISDVEVNNKTLGVGWNFGDFFNMPFDLAIGANTSRSDLEYKQTINNANTLGTNVDTNINLDSNTSVYWAGLSKTFAFFTPYVKVGTAHSSSKVKTSAASIFLNDPARRTQTVHSNGSFYAVGANVSFFFFKLGAEYSESANIRRASGKISLDF